MQFRQTCPIFLPRFLKTFRSKSRKEPEKCSISSLKMFLWRIREQFSKTSLFSNASPKKTFAQYQKTENYMFSNRKSLFSLIVYPGHVECSSNSSPQMLGQKMKNLTLKIPKKKTFSFFPQMVPLET